MWPFARNTEMTINRIDDRFSVTGQIRPDQVARLAALGYTIIMCARPDHEEAGQPTFAEVAQEAQRHGLKAVHVPVSGMPSPEQQGRFRSAMAGCDGPALGYCRSGARAANLYAMLGR